MAWQYAPDDTAVDYRHQNSQEQGFEIAAEDSAEKDEAGKTIHQSAGTYMAGRFSHNPDTKAGYEVYPHKYFKSDRTVEVEGNNSKY